MSEKSEHEHEFDDTGECECGEHEGRGFSSHPPPHFPEPLFEPRIKHDPVRWGIDSARKIGEAFNLRPDRNVDDGAKLAEIAAVLAGFAAVANAVRRPKRKGKK